MEIVKLLLVPLAVGIIVLVIEYGFIQPLKEYWDYFVFVIWHKFDVSPKRQRNIVKICTFIGAVVGLILGFIWGGSENILGLFSDSFFGIVGLLFGGVIGHALAPIWYLLGCSACVSLLLAWIGGGIAGLIDGKPAINIGIKLGAIVGIILVGVILFKPKCSPKSHKYLKLPTCSECGYLVRLQGESKIFSRKSLFLLPSMAILFPLGLFLLWKWFVLLGEILFADSKPFGVSLLSAIGGYGAVGLAIHFSLQLPHTSPGLICGNGHQIKFSESINIKEMRHGLKWTLECEEESCAHSNFQRMNLVSRILSA
jgi:hypothetical protein